VPEPNHLQVQHDLAARIGTVNVLAVTAGFVARAVHHETDDLRRGDAKHLVEVGAQGVAVVAAGRGPRIGLSVEGQHGDALADAVGGGGERARSGSGTSSAT
jgi:hypothetical protein